jgi:hypothetical protein
MPLVLADRVQETTTTVGTGTLNLSGAVTGFQTFVAGIGTGNTTLYCIEDGTDWEVGLGTVTDGSPDTLSRTTILASSNGGSAVNFGAGTKNVFCTLPASRMFLVESKTFQSVGAVGDDTIYLSKYMPYAGSIASLQDLATSSGTVTLTVKINGTNVTGLASLSVSSTPQSPSASGANTFVVGDEISVHLSSASSAQNLIGALLLNKGG